MGYRSNAIRWVRDHYVFSGYNKHVLLHRDGVIVFPELGIAYNRIKKAGNTSISAFFAELAGYQLKSAMDVKRGILSPSGMGIRQALQFPALFLLTFVRNPYARLLSAFLDQSARMKSPVLEGAPGYGQGDPDGFAAFVNFLGEGGWKLNRHFWPQSELLCAPLQRFDHVGKLEQLVTDMQVVLERVGIPAERASALERPHSLQRHQTGASTKLETYYSGPTMDKIRRVYSTDFSLFDYASDLPASEG